MEDNKFVICRLCLKIVRDNNFKLLGNIELDMLDMLAPMNMCITSGSAVCKTCHENLLTCYNFKATCIEMDDKKNTLEEEKVDSEDTNPTNIKLCSLCLENVDDEMLKEIHLGVKDALLTLLLERCLPELDVHRMDMAACSKCFKFLEMMFSFINECQITEEKVDKFCIAKKLNKQNELNLLDIIIFLQTNSMNINQPEIEHSLSSSGHSNFTSIDHPFVPNFKSAETGQNEINKTDTTVKNNDVNMDAEAPQSSNFISPSYSEFVSLSDISQPDVKLEPVEKLEFIANNNEACLNISSENCDIDNIKLIEHKLISLNHNDISTDDRNCCKVKSESDQDVNSERCLTFNFQQSTIKDKSDKNNLISSNCEGISTDCSCRPIGKAKLEQDVGTFVDFEGNIHVDENKCIEIKQEEVLEGFYLPSTSSQNTSALADQYVNFEPNNLSAKGPNSPPVIAGLADRLLQVGLKKSNWSPELIEELQALRPKGSSPYKPLKHRMKMADGRSIRITIPALSKLDHRDKNVHVGLEEIRKADLKHEKVHSPCNKNKENCLEGYMKEVEENAMERCSLLSSLPQDLSTMPEHVSLDQALRIQPSTYLIEDPRRKKRKIDKTQVKNNPISSNYEKISSAGDSCRPIAKVDIDNVSAFTDSERNKHEDRSNLTPENINGFNGKSKGFCAEVERTISGEEGRSVERNEKNTTDRCSILSSSGNLNTPSDEFMKNNKHEDMIEQSQKEIKEELLPSLPQPDLVNLNQTLRTQLKNPDLNVAPDKKKRKTNNIQVENDLISSKCEVSSIDGSYHPIAKVDLGDMSIFTNSELNKHKNRHKCMEINQEEVLESSLPSTSSQKLSSISSECTNSEPNDISASQAVRAALAERVLQAGLNRRNWSPELMADLQALRSKWNYPHSRFKFILKTADGRPLRITLPPLPRLDHKDKNVLGKLGETRQANLKPGKNKDICVSEGNINEVEGESVEGNGEITAERCSLPLSSPQASIAPRGEFINNDKCVKMNERSDEKIREELVPSGSCQILSTLAMPEPINSSRTSRRQLESSDLDDCSDKKKTELAERLLKAGLKQSKWSPELISELLALRPKGSSPHRRFSYQLRTVDGRSIRVRIPPLYKLGFSGKSGEIYADLEGNINKKERKSVKSNEENAKERCSLPSSSSENLIAPSSDFTKSNKSVKMNEQCDGEIKEGSLPSDSSQDLSALAMRDLMNLSQALRKQLESIDLDSQSDKRKRKHTSSTTTKPKHKHRRLQSEQDVNERNTSDRSKKRSRHDDEMNGIKRAKRATKHNSDIRSKDNRTSGSRRNSLGELRATGDPSDWTPDLLLRLEQAALLPQRHSDNENQKPQRIADNNESVKVEVSQTKSRSKLPDRLATINKSSTATSGWKRQLLAKPEPKQRLRKECSDEAEIKETHSSSGKVIVWHRKSRAVVSLELEKVANKCQSYIAPYHYCPLGRHTGFCAATIGLAEQVRVSGNFWTPKLRRRLAAFFIEGSRYTKKRKFEFKTSAGALVQVYLSAANLGLDPDGFREGNFMNNDFFNDNSWNELNNSKLRCNYWLASQLLATPEPADWSPILKQRLASLFHRDYPNNKWVKKKIMIGNKEVLLTISRDMLELETTQCEGNSEKLTNEEPSSSLCQKVIAPRHRCKLGTHTGFCAATVGLAEQVRDSKSISAWSPALRQRLANFLPDGCQYNMMRRCRFLTASGDAVRTTITAANLRLGGVNEKFFDYNCWDILIHSELKLREQQQQYIQANEEVSTNMTVTSSHHLPLPHLIATNWLAQQLLASPEPTHWSLILRLRLATLFPGNYPDDAWLIPELITVADQPVHIRICRDMLKIKQLGIPEPKQIAGKHLKENISENAREVRKEDLLLSSRQIVISSSHQCKLGFHKGFCAATIGLAEQIHNSQGAPWSHALCQRLAIFLPEGYHHYNMTRKYRFHTVSGEKVWTQITPADLRLGDINETFFEDKCWNELICSELKSKDKQNIETIKEEARNMGATPLRCHIAISWLAEQLTANPEPAKWSSKLRQRLATLIPMSYPDDAWLIPELMTSAGQPHYIRICREMLRSLGPMQDSSERFEKNICRKAEKAIEEKPSSSLCEQFVAPHHPCKLGLHRGFCALTIGVAEQLRNQNAVTWSPALKQRLTTFLPELCDSNNKFRFLTVSGESVWAWITPLNLRLGGINENFFKDKSWNELFNSNLKPKNMCQIATNWLVEQLLASSESAYWSPILRKRLTSLIPVHYPDDTWLIPQLRTPAGKLISVRICKRMLRSEPKPDIIERSESKKCQLVSDSSGLCQKVIAPHHRCKLGTHTGFCAATVGVAEQIRHSIRTSDWSPALGQRLATFLPEGPLHNLMQIYQFCTVSGETVWTMITPAKLKLSDINEDFFRDKSWDDLINPELRTRLNLTNEEVAKNMADTPLHVLSLSRRIAINWLVEQLLATSESANWSPVLRQRLATLIPASYPYDAWLIPEFTTKAGKPFYFKIGKEILRLNPKQDTSEHFDEKESSLVADNSGNAKKLIIQTTNLSQENIAPYHQCRLGPHAGFCAATIGLAEQMRESQSTLAWSPALRQRLALFLPEGYFYDMKQKCQFYDTSGQIIQITITPATLKLGSINKNFFKDKSWDELISSELKKRNIQTNEGEATIKAASPRHLLPSPCHIATHWLIEQLLATSKSASWSTVLRQRLASLIPESYPDDAWLIPELTITGGKPLYIRICRRMLRPDPEQDSNKHFERNESEMVADNSENAKKFIRGRSSSSSQQKVVAPRHRCKLGFHTGFCSLTIGVAEQLCNQYSSWSPALRQRLAIFLPEGSNNEMRRQRFSTVSDDTIWAKITPATLRLDDINEDFKDKS